ncbi:hypothetical protein MMC13_007189 [Lambiella insularis]|nr:hypothetical protein [Lambiella insularis]
MYPSASCTIKSETAIRKLFKWLAGNYWYGFKLTAWVYRCEFPEGELLDCSDVSCFEQPLHLEKFLLIKDSLLIRPTPVVPSISPSASGTISMPVTHNHVGAYNNAVINNQEVVLESSTNSTAFVSSRKVDQSIGYGQVASPSSPIPGWNENMVLQQRLQHYAYQMLRNHRPAQEGPVWSPYILTNAAVYAAPLDTIGPAFAAYPVCNLPAAVPLAIPYPDYYANPDGTPVNTTQGVVPVDESRAVLVRNINHRASLEEIKAHLNPAGLIEHCDKAISRHDARKCTARITFGTPRDAKEAVRRFNDTDFMGRRIMIDIAKDDSTAERLQSLSEASLTENTPLVSKTKGRVIIADGSEEHLLLEQTQSDSSRKKGKNKIKRKQGVQVM